MLTRNLSIKGGLVNGTIGRIVDFVKENEDENVDKVDFVIVDFPNYKGSSIICTYNSKLVPIKRESAVNGCMNFPLVAASAMTIHKSQGSTFDFKISIDIGDKETMGSSFVGFSRVKKFDDLVVKPFDYERFLMIGEGKYIKDRVEIMEKMSELEFKWKEI